MDDGSCGPQSKHSKTNGPEQWAWQESHGENEEEAWQKNQADETCRGGHKVKRPLLKESGSPWGLFGPSHGNDCW